MSKIAYCMKCCKPADDECDEAGHPYEYVEQIAQCSECGRDISVDSYGSLCVVCADVHEALREMLRIRLDTDP